MEYRCLGGSELEVSAVGLGCNNFGMSMDRAQTTEVVSAAIDHGITLFDTADIYGNGDSEKYLGSALGKMRADVIIATKFGNPMAEGLTAGASRKYITTAVEDSLKRLNTDYIDLYQIHTPDVNTPIEETLQALTDLVTAGKVRYIGCSNFASWQLVESELTSRSVNSSRCVSTQSRYSLLSRNVEGEVLPVCEKYAISLLPYFPLESGLLTGKYQKDLAPEKGTRRHAWKDFGEFGTSFWSEQNFAQVERLQELCKKFDHTLIELAFGWLLHKPQVGSVIAGATRVEQIKGNVKAGLFRPTEEELELIDQIISPGISPTAWGS